MINWNILFIILGIYLVINAITYVAMYVDKQKAIKDKYRISENTLFTMSLCGGFIGSYLGMQKFRHKTKHMSFYLVNILSLIIHLLLTYFVYFNLVYKA